jgi:hypothetical protein
VDAQGLKRLFSVDEFHQMGEARVFGEHDRQPAAGEYGRHRRVGSGESLDMPGAGAQRLPVDDVLP